jgi:hypothetical protein
LASAWIERKEENKNESSISHDLDMYNLETKIDLVCTRREFLSTESRE